MARSGRNISRPNLLLCEKTSQVAGASRELQGLTCDCQSSVCPVTCSLLQPISSRIGGSETVAAARFWTRESHSATVRARDLVQGSAIESQRASHNSCVTVVENDASMRPRTKEQAFGGCPANKWIARSCATWRCAARATRTMNRGSGWTLARLVPSEVIAGWQGNRVTLRRENNVWNAAVLNSGSRTHTWLKCHQNAYRARSSSARRVEEVGSCYRQKL